MLFDIEELDFPNNLDLRLSARIYRCRRASARCVIFSHGLFSTKDGYKITNLVETITSAGLNVFTFDFSFAGLSGPDISELSVYQEVEDLKSALDFVMGLGMTSVHLMGSSLGALVSLLCATGRREGIDSLMLIAAPFQPMELVRSLGIMDAAEIPEDGYMIVQGRRIRNGFFRELASIDMEGILSGMDKPLLAIHGGRDGIIDTSGLEILRDSYGGPVQICIIEDGDHNLTRQSDLDYMRREIVAWLGDGR
jgi:pimeloyl-ACP methyl ester carboxylesterase